MAKNELQTLHTTCCIVGGGPAGIMLAFLLARSGIDATVLEKHKDFLRDFRGDTIHSSTMELLHELGLLEKFLALPHQKSHKLAGYVNDEEIVLADFTRLKLKAPYIAFMPQWDFLNFLVEQAEKYSNFRLLMETEARDVIEENGSIVGVKAKTKTGDIEIKADLTVGADGRDSRVREKAGLEVKSEKVKMDVLWFKIPRDKSDPSFSLGHIKAGQFLVMIERGTYWQCGYVIPKGKFEEIKKQDIENFHKDLHNLAGIDMDILQKIKSWDDFKLLSVKVDHLEKWYRKGLVCIGDASHAMSPIGGVGINLAIQDAVAAARILAPNLKNGNVTIDTLKKIQKRRKFPARIIQRLQILIQNKVIIPTIKAKKLEKPALPFRLVQKFPPLRRVTARLIGVGIRPEYINS